MEIIKWLQDYSAVVQALTAVIIMVITTIYVFLTYKLLHTAHKAFVRPVSLTTKDRGWAFRVHNYGPGLATGVQVKTVVVTKMMLDPLDKENLKVWTSTEFLSAEGPYEIPPNQDAEYSFDYLMSFEYPIFVSWKSVTGNSQSTSWLIFIEQKDRIVPLTIWGFIKFNVKWLRINILTPYYNLCKWWRTKKAEKDKDKNKENGANIV